jgi:hypothetical protein
MDQAMEDKNRRTVIHEVTFWEFNLERQPEQTSNCHKIQATPAE